MSIGKKIGGGFCAVIFLTMVLGFVAIRGMSEGTEVSENIANDRMPRLINWMDLQNDLLNAAYYARAYFENSDAANIKQTFDYLKLYKEKLAALKQINSVIHFENTAKALERAEKNIVIYEDLIRKNQALNERAEALVVKMMSSGNEALAKIAVLIKTMGETQRGFIQAGNSSAATQYSQNLVDAATMYTDASTVFRELLAAERNSDVALFAEIQQRLPGISKKSQAIAGNLLRQECRDLFAETMKEYNEFSREADELATVQRDLAEAGKTRYAQFRTMFANATGMVELTTKNTNQVVTDAASSLSASTTVVTIMLIIVLVLGVIVSITITRMIVKPLATTQVFAQDVAAGHMEKELDVHTTDETGKLADALRSMVAALKQNISEANAKSEQAAKATEEAKAAMARAEEAARKAENAKREGMLAAAGQLEGMVEIISSASTELSAQIEQSDHGASESAQRLQEAATAMNEMNATVQEVARNAGSASTASTDTKAKAEAGEHVVQQVVQSIGEVHEVSLQLKEDMVQLNERAQDISRIMGVISDIADQTNLLALNAAIEAARAGEAGRGFAVVADEVRKLAEKTMASTQDVSNAIRAIQESTDKSMGAVDNAVQRISEATSLANQSGTALEEIVATVEATSDQVQAIAAASEEQSAASEEINRSIIEVNDMSRLTAEAMAGANQAVADLASQANKLNNLIQEMKNA
ncbi:HAMP domain-containing methyl-accepting chemotaxis protein [uncultured Desulfovibrio sp.]|uniref:methyl-accepting chemotaxis protein n=1 Tax=uncultured Desulfovibrio sp. TaxID=167968 RepID=UPI0028038A54|nr:HAMP domain-containing methyl-accepting chemotaxis protein [uncultured Desulfovibrio sp.]